MALVRYTKPPVWQRALAYAPTYYQVARSLYNTGRKYYSYYKKSRRPPKPMRQVVFKRSRRNTSNRKYKDPRSNLNKRRKSVGLPTLEPKHHEITENNYQWTTGTWELQYNLTTIAKGTGENDRVSDKITILPSVLKLQLQQPTSMDLKYRVMLIKMLDKEDTEYTDLGANQVLRDYSTNWDLSTYNLKEDRPVDFKVIHDRLYYFNTYTPRNQQKLITIKVPKMNVVYDPDTSAGTASTNNIMLCVKTNATEANSNYSVDIFYYTSFLDQV